MNSQPDLSIIIPAFNEALRIGRTLEAVEGLSEHPAIADKSVEVLVVCDGCTDDTEQVVSEWSGRLPLKCITYCQNRGKGYAVRRGIEAATGKLIAFMDADGSTPVHELPRLAEPIWAGRIDVVIGSRRATDSNVTRPQPWPRRLLGGLLSQLTRRVTGIPFLDTQCGFKLFSGYCAHQLFGELRRDGFDFDLELLARAQRKRFRVLEVGVEWRDAAGSRVSLISDGFALLRTAFEQRVWREFSPQGGDRAAAKKALGPPLALFLGVLVIRLLLLPHWPLTDPTEGRYAQIALEMARADDWVIPRVWMDGELVPFLGKPPLLFWAAASSIIGFGENEFAVRLPSLVVGGFLGLLMLIVLRRYTAIQIGSHSLLFLISAPFVFVMFGTVTFDPMLTLFVTGSLLAYFAFTQEPDLKRRTRWSLLVFFLLGGGFLTKGPVALAQFGMPVLVWTVVHRRWRDFRAHAWLPGIALFLLIAAPWFILAEYRSPGFLKYFFINENLLRFVVHDYGDRYGYGHQQPRGTALIMMMVAAFPWTLYALYRLVRYRKSCPWLVMLKNPIFSFFLYGFAVDVLFWCLARQLLIGYMLPMVPLFMVWLALLIQEQEKCSVPTPNSYLKPALVSVGLTVMLCLAAIPVLSRSVSSRHLVRTAMEPHEAGGNSRLLSVHRTPYSVCFYARDWFVPHPRESVDDSMRRGGELNAQVLYLIRVEHLHDLSPEIRENMQVVARHGGNLLFELPIRR